MRKHRQDTSSDFTHVTQRGLGRRIVFEDDEDKRAFLYALAARRPLEVDVVAWCLMGNHLHLLFRGDWRAVSRLMQRALTSYAQRYNGRHGHVGKVFQGRFSSTAVRDERHLLAAIRYIHRNALDAGVKRLEEWPWSSYRQIAGIAPCEGANVCNASVALAAFGGREGFERFHADDAVSDGFCDAFARRPRMADDEARAIACRHFGNGFADGIASMPKQQRDEALGTLKALGLSVRQIERLTGIGRNIVTRAR